MKNEKNDTNSTILNLAIRYIYLLLAIISIIKALQGGLAICNILFKQAIIYWILALEFAMAFAYNLFIVKINAKAVLKASFYIALFIALLAIAVLIVLDYNSSYYTAYESIPSNLNIIRASDVVRSDYVVESDQDTVLVRSFSPYLGASITTVDQFLANDNNAFYSIKINASKCVRNIFALEILSYLSRNYNSQFNTATNTGFFFKDNHIYTFALVSDDIVTAMCIYTDNVTIKIDE